MPESAPRTVTVAATQFACSWDLPDNLDRAERLVRAAHARGAQVILLQELFATPYFCIEQDVRHLQLAQTVADSPVLRRFGALAAELAVVLPISFFERAGNAYFNSLAMFDADGRRLGIYRKSHIPNGPGYQEKFYFSPGDTGFRVWQTRCGSIGVGVCWDQWFPESARIMALLGAELLLSGPRSDIDVVSAAPVQDGGYLLAAVYGELNVTPAWSVTARLDNALNRNYQLANGYNTGGRAASVSTRYSFR